MTPGELLAFEPLEFTTQHELGGGAHPIDEENPIEMIGLVLDDPGEKVGGFQFELIPIQVGCPDVQIASAADLSKRFPHSLLVISPWPW